MRGVENVPWLYDAALALLEHGGLGRWRRWLAGGALGRTLDLGSGTGRNLPLLPPDAAAVAVDPRRESLDRARRRAPRVPAVIARAEALPFRDGTFDTVLCGFVLCSVDDPSAALAEARRVLAPGGALRAMEHVRPAGIAGAIADAAQPAWTFAAGGCHPNRETEAALEAAGFRIDAGTRRAHGAMLRVVARPDAPPPGDRPLRPGPRG